MECARGYEKYEVCLHRAVLCGNRAALDYGQYVTLHAFAGYVCAAGIAAGGYLVYLVDEYYTVLLRPLYGNPHLQGAEDERR